MQLCSPSRCAVTDPLLDRVRCCMARVARARCPHAQDRYKRHSPQHASITHLRVTHKAQRTRCAHSDLSPGHCHAHSTRPRTNGMATPAACEAPGPTSLVPAWPHEHTRAARNPTHRCARHFGLPRASASRRRAEQCCVGREPLVSVAGGRATTRAALAASSTGRAPSATSRSTAPRPTARPRARTPRRA